nr:uncharacterized protein LOC127329627 [Lolium perenne]
MERSCDARGGGALPPSKPSPLPSPLCSRPSPVGGGLGGRFWALTPAEDDAEAVSEASDDLPSSPSTVTGKPSPSPSFGLFLRAAEALGGSLRSARRSAFAPGGRPSRFPSGGGGGAGSVPGWSGSTRGFARAEARRRRRFPATDWVSVRSSSPEPGRRWRPSLRLARRTRRWRRRRRGGAPLGRLGTSRSPGCGAGLGLDVGPACSLSLSSEAQESQLALELWAEKVVAAQAHRRSVQGPVGAESLIRLRIRRGCSNLELGFPATHKTCAATTAPRARGRRAAVRVREEARGPAASGAEPVRSGVRTTARERRRRGGSEGRSGAGRAQQPQQPLRSEAALRDRALVEQGRRRQGQGGSRAGAGANKDPPAWWVAREKKREARRALEAAPPLVPPSIPELGRGRASETAAGKQPVVQDRPATGSGPSRAAAVEEVPTPASNMECFKCGRMGHFQASCTFPPVCLLCGVEGHKSNACLSKGKQPELRILGQAVPGESFFYLDFDEDEDEEEEVTNGAVISFRQVVFSAADLSRELQHLVEADWDWQVQEVGRNEFAVLFPSRESLQFSTRSGRLFLPLSGTVADIRLADADPAPVELLQEVWVKLTGVPKRMRWASRLLAGMRMLGWPMEVDEVSLRCRQPVRMRIACRNPDKLQGVVQVFHKKQGFSIGVHVEPLAGQSGSAPPRSPPRPPHPRDEEEEDDDDVDDLSPSRKGSDERDDRAVEHEGGSPTGRGVPSGSHGQATSPGARALQGSPEAVVAPVPPAVAALLGVGLDQYGSNLRAPWPAPLAALERARARRLVPEEPVGSGTMVARPASPPFDSSTLISADSVDATPSGSPSKDLGGAESLVSIGVLDSDEMMREASELDEATVARSDGPGAGVPRRRRTSTVPAEPARKSARLTGPGAATPVLQRAQERTASRNLDPAGVEASG